MSITDSDVGGLLAGLDEDQRLAASAPPEPLVVAAGAGSGKTRMLTHRVAHLVEGGEINPSRTLVTTFTAQAASELEERLGPLLGPNRKLVRVQTMHAWMWAIIKKWRDLNGLCELDVPKQWEIKDLVRGLLGPPSSDYPDAIDAFEIDLSVVFSEISRWKALLIGPASPKVVAQAGSDDPDLAAAARIYPLYEKYLTARDWIDFDGMLVEGHRLLTIDESVRTGVRRNTEGLFCDEGQDTNHAQWEILNLVAPPKDRPCFTLVGDARQAIYQWRNAMPDRFLDAPTHWGAQVVHLTKNYRSLPEIVTAANQVIAPVGLPDMTPVRVDPGTVTGWETDTPTDEADTVALWARTHIDAGARGSALAVLARTNAQTVPVERALFHAGIPYFCASGSFFNRGEVKILMGYLRLVNDPTDGEALNTIINKPTRYLGAKYVEQVQRTAGRSGNLIRTLTRVTTYASRRMSRKQLEAASDLARLLADIKQMGPDPALRAVLDRTNFKTWLKTSEGNVTGPDETSTDNIAALVGLAGEFRTIGRFLQHADDIEANMKDSDDAVRISTIHRAKGQEWDHVTVIGVSDLHLPHYMSVWSGNGDEERRLAYVAATRARNTLTMSYSLTTPKGEPQGPSGFFADMGVTVNPHPPVDQTIIHVTRPDWLVEGLEPEPGPGGQQAMFGA